MEHDASDPDVVGPLAGEIKSTYIVIRESP